MLNDPTISSFYNRLRFRMNSINLPRSLFLFPPWALLPVPLSPSPPWRYLQLLTSNISDGIKHINARQTTWYVSAAPRSLIIRAGEILETSTRLVYMNLTWDTELTKGSTSEGPRTRGPHQEPQGLHINVSDDAVLGVLHHQFHKEGASCSKDHLSSEQYYQILLIISLTTTLWTSMVSLPHCNL